MLTKQVLGIPNWKQKAPTRIHQIGSSRLAIAGEAVNIGMPNGGGKDVQIQVSYMQGMESSGRFRS